MSKLKIKNYIAYHWFYNYEKVGTYYLDIEFKYSINITFLIHHKIVIYIYGIISFICFLLAYFYDIKFLTLFLSFFSISSFTYIHSGLSFMFYYLNIIILYKFWFLIFILCLIMLIYIIKFNIKIALNWLYVFIYRRLNFMINLQIFLYVTNLDLAQYIEYNFIFILFIFINLIKNFFMYLFLNKSFETSDVIHFLGLPIIIHLFTYLFLIHSKFFYEIFYYISFLNRKFFIISYKNKK